MKESKSMEGCVDIQGNQNEEKDSKGGTAASRLIDLVTPSTEFFKNELGEGHAAIDYGDHREIYPIDSKQFKRFLVRVFYEAERMPIKNEHLMQALAVLDTNSEFSNKTLALGKRVAYYKNSIFYDLTNDNWEVIKITKQGCSLVNKPPILFTRSNNMKSQVLPDFTTSEKEFLPLLNKHFRITKASDKILFAVYLVSCLVPDIPHPILVIYGEKGASKSTSMRMIKSIIDPSRCDLLTLPTSIHNLALSLSSNYMPAYDNLQKITPEISDILCMGSTGGSFSTRTLYTNGDETIVSFKRAIILNGINVVASRADLLDRSLILEMERIKEVDRKPESIVWSDFERDKPKILNAGFNALSKAMSIVPKVKLDRMGRMGDFCVWGFAIAEAIGINGEAFLNAYLENQENANEEAIESHPLAASLVEYMRNKKNWSGSVAKLLDELKNVASEHSINTNDALFPKASHVLSMRLKEVKTNLEQVGISYNITNAGDFKKIVITNSNYENK